MGKKKGKYPVRPGDKIKKVRKSVDEYQVILKKFVDEYDEYSKLPYAETWKLKELKQKISYYTKRVEGTFVSSRGKSKSLFGDHSDSFAKSLGKVNIGQPFKVNFEFEGTSDLIAASVNNTAVRRLLRTAFNNITNNEVFENFLKELASENLYNAKTGSFMPEVLEKYSTFVKRYKEYDKRFEAYYKDHVDAIDYIYQGPSVIDIARFYKIVRVGDKDYDVVKRAVENPVTFVDRLVFDWKKNNQLEEEVRNWEDVEKTMGLATRDGSDPNEDERFNGYVEQCSMLLSYMVSGGIIEGGDAAYIKYNINYMTLGQIIYFHRWLQMYKLMWGDPKSLGAYMIEIMEGLIGGSREIS